MTKETGEVGRQPLLGFPVDAPDFDTMAVTPSNETTLAIVKQWRNWPTPALCVFGPPQSGRTTICRAWSGLASAEQVDAAAFDELGHGDVEALSAGAVALDDADAVANEDNLLSLINLADRAGGRILLTSETKPASWRAANADLASRLRSMPVAELAPPDEDMLRARLEAAGRRRFLRLGDELLNYLVRRLGRSYAGLEDYAARLSEAVAKQNRAPSIPLARDVLQAGGAFDYAPDEDDEDD